MIDVDAVLPRFEAVAPFLDERGHLLFSDPVGDQVIAATTAK